MVIKKIKEIISSWTKKGQDSRGIDTISLEDSKDRNEAVLNVPEHKEKGNSRQGDQRKNLDRKSGKKSKNRYRAPVAKGKQRPWSISDFQVAPSEGKTRFHDFDIPVKVMHAIAMMGFEFCTPIQAEILPHIMKGKDAIGRAQTGTGKTAAFLVSAITHLLNNPIRGKRPYGTPRVLILAPTRELAMQIEEEAKALARFTGIRVMSVFGGMDYEKQRKRLRGKVIDIVTATPGRLLDFHKTHDLHLSKVEVLVIDEADRMLDMGFIPDVRHIVNATPPKGKRQTMLFSATITPEVKRLADQWTREPVVVDIDPGQVAVDSVNQIVYIITSDEKYALLYNVIERQGLGKVIVFCNRRDETRRVADMLRSYGISTDILSGEVPQKKRIRTLEAFKKGKTRVLVATDVAGRGIHVEGISHVINYTLPHDPEDYVHRIGRTGRAGALGTAISFASETDSFYLPEIEEFMGQKLVCTIPDESWLKLPPRRAAPNGKKGKSHHSSSLRRRE